MKKTSSTRAPALTRSPVMPSWMLATSGRPGSSARIAPVTIVAAWPGLPIATTSTAAVAPIAAATASWKNSATPRRAR